MNIILELLKKFFLEETTTILLIIAFSFVINIFQANGVSYITSRIIINIQKDNEKVVYEFLKIFMMFSSAFIFLFYTYKYLQNNLLNKLQPWIKKYLINLLFITNNENLSDINLNTFSSPINRVTYVCFMLFTDFLTHLLPNITFVCVLLSYLLFINKNLGLSFLLGNICIFAYLYFTWQPMKDANHAYEKDINDNDSYILEMLSNIDKIIYRGKTQVEMDIYKEKSKAAEESAKNFFSLTNNNTLVMNILLHINLFVCLFFITYLYFDGKLSMTEFITLYTIILLYKDKLMNIIQQIPDLIEFVGRTESVLNIFKKMDVNSVRDTNFDKLYTTDYKKVRLPFNTIRFENVTFKFSTTNQEIFKDLNMTIHPTDHKVVGIVGLSGKGKSTLAKLIMKLHRPTSGNIYIDDANINDVCADYIRENITYINQNSKLFDRKIIENILYACNDLDVCNRHLAEIMKYEKIVELYKNMDIHSKKAGPLGENLSGGQRQVINVISGLINPSKILILDEPTNGLDPQLKTELLAIIKDFRKHKQSIIIISHDKECFELFDETITI